MKGSAQCLGGHVELLRGLVGAGQAPWAGKNVGVFERLGLSERDPEYGQCWQRVYVG